MAFVTGAGRGMGREIARKLASKGLNIIVTDVNMENASETVSLLKAEGQEAVRCLLRCYNIRECPRSCSNCAYSFRYD